MTSELLWRERALATTFYPAMKPIPKQPSLVILLGVSFWLFVGSFILNDMIRWTNPWAGFVSALAQSGIYGIFWLVVGLIPGLLIAGIYRQRKWGRFRTIAVVSPSIGVFCYMLSSLITNPPTASHRFKRFTGVDFPSSAREVRTNFTGGGIADYDDAYLFHCAPADTEKLMADLKMEPADSMLQLRPPPAPGWPNPSTWGEIPGYYGERHWFGSSWYYLLFTNESRDAVYLFVCGI